MTIREWFLDLKLPQAVMANEMAMAQWERALSDPDHKGKVYAFWCLAGCDRYLPPMPVDTTDPQV